MGARCHGADFFYKNEAAQGHKKVNNNKKTLNAAPKKNKGKNRR